MVTGWDDGMRCRPAAAVAAAFATAFVAPMAIAGPCASAAGLAERAWGLPPNLLVAIGIVESGLDPNALNVEGAPRRPGSPAAAVAEVRAEQARGVRSIDTGCFQVNLKWHAQAFPTLEDAFDPTANAMYAARFLAELYGDAGSWTNAVGLYHSADPALQVAYQGKVIAAVRALRAGAAPDALAGAGVGPIGEQVDAKASHGAGGWPVQALAPLRLARAAATGGWALGRGDASLVIAAAPHQPQEAPAAPPSQDARISKDLP